MFLYIIASVIYVYLMLMCSNEYNCSVSFRGHVYVATGRNHQIIGHIYWHLVFLFTLLVEHQTVYLHVQPGQLRTSVS